MSCTHIVWHVQAPYACSVIVLIKLFHGLPNTSCPFEDGMACHFAHAAFLYRMAVGDL